MKTLQKGLQLILAVAALGLASAAQAVPTLNFDGELQYLNSPSPGVLSISGGLVGSTNIVPNPILTGSDITLGAAFLGSSTSGGMVTGSFGGVSGDDLVITDGTGGIGTLLTAEIVSLSLSGPEGLDFGGTLMGDFIATGGSLLSEFGTSKTFATVLNLDTIYASNMYTGDFAGQVNGSIYSTPEPGMLVLLSLGLGLFGIGARYKRKV